MKPVKLFIENVIFWIEHIFGGKKGRLNIEQTRTMKQAIHIKQTIHIKRTLSIKQTSSIDQIKNIQTDYWILKIMIILIYLN